MFYEPTLSKALRLGDVVKGLIWAAAHIDRPLSDARSLFALHVEHPQFAAILTPCCAIEREEVVIAPLVRLRPAMLRARHLAEDPTRVNGPMKPQHAIPASEWQKLTDEARIRRFGPDFDRPGFHFLDAFVYEAHPMLGHYELDTKAGKMPCSHHMISFKHVAKVECECIKRAGQDDFPLKVLELTVTARQALRRKLVRFYGNPPLEDLQKLGESPQ